MVCLLHSRRRFLSNFSNALSARSETFCFILPSMTLSMLNHQPPLGIKDAHFASLQRGFHRQSNHHTTNRKFHDE